MSQKRIWVGRLHHSRQIENHHRKDEILVSPEGDQIDYFPKFYHLSTNFSSKSIQKGVLFATLKFIPNLVISNVLWILAKSVRNRHASFTSETQNVYIAFAPR